MEPDYDQIQPRAHGNAETASSSSASLAFKPSSESPKLDAAIVARHIVDDVIGGR